MSEKEFWQTRLKICPVCGKKFSAFYLNEWLYKIGNEYYCSYTCWNKVLSEKESKGRSYHTVKDVHRKKRNKFTV